MKKRFLLALVLIFQTQTLGQNDIDKCNALISRVKVESCYQKIYTMRDKNLNAIYRLIYSKLKSKNDLLSLKNYVNEQKAWTKFRDASCKFARGLARGGHEESFIYIVCMVRETEIRNKTLLEYKNNPAIY
jgi:uncharacterized protein YecT (DUF1311 family)